MKRNSRTDKTLLTMDPSMTGWGWAIVRWDGVVLDAGCVRTSSENKKRRIRKGDDNVRRTEEIIQILVDLIRKYNVNYILTELPHGAQNYNAAVMIGRTEGAVTTLGLTFNIGVEWWSENDAKKHVLRKTNATKQEMINAVKKELDVPWGKYKYQNEGIADALAIYLTARDKSSTLKLLTT